MRRDDEMTRAVVLVSGGLDSATVLAMARQQGLECYALSVNYGQRHSAELNAAARVAKSLGAKEHRTMHVDLGGIGGSALTDNSIAVPQTPQVGIPITYVPARNTMMLSLALGWAEVLGASQIHMIDLTKAQIIRQGLELGVDFSQTVSCYQADTDGRACGQCDSCRLRRDGFMAAGAPDPTRYFR
jgi:7-cyano-7-deazaguanine synthase